MTFLERVADPARLRHWRGDMEADYIYTAGVAGERFLRALSKDGTLVTSECEHCGIAFLPARMYCERCLNTVTTWGEAPDEGAVEAFTIARKDIDGNTLEDPEVWALVRFEGVEGGLVHRLLVDPKKAKAKMAVVAKLRKKSERTGEITDLLGFEPA